ncbi:MULTISPECIES: STM3941 family protein [unclassified Carboxylicivirga]|uniref:STM3941 family protein n=1 Tax=Carboxylicivirga TaxID=1628153 RepID=UPI003D33827D
MSQNKLIEIPLSYTKLAWTIVGAIIFVILGLGIIFYPAILNIAAVGNRTLTSIIGLATIAFFGTVAIVNIRKTLHNKHGLIISTQGLTNYSYETQATTIPWSDILEIKPINTPGQKIIVITVKNPDAYIERETNKFKRKAMELNYKTLGSPLHLSTHSLKISFEKLHALLVQKLNEYKQADTTS